MRLSGFRLYLRCSGGLTLSRTSKELIHRTTPPRPLPRKKMSGLVKQIEEHYTTDEKHVETEACRIIGSALRNLLVFSTWQGTPVFMAPEMILGKASSIFLHVSSGLMRTRAFEVASASHRARRLLQIFGVWEYACTSSLAAQDNELGLWILHIPALPWCEVIGHFPFASNCSNHGQTRSQPALAHGVCRCSDEGRKDKPTSLEKPSKIRGTQRTTTENQSELEVVRQAGCQEEASM